MSIIGKCLIFSLFQPCNTGREMNLSEWKLRYNIHKHTPDAHTLHDDWCVKFKTQVFFFSLLRRGPCIHVYRVIYLI
jgi:hypothetical protein